MQHEDAVSDGLQAIGSDSKVSTEHWRIFRVGQERFVVLQYMSGAPGRLQVGGPILSVDPNVPRVYGRFGSSFELHGSPDREPAFIAKAHELLARRASGRQIEDESDRLYSQWRSAMQ
jgi:hypothetical protein